MSDDPLSGAEPLSSASRYSKKSYLLGKEYQRADVLEYFALGERGALELFAKVRWGDCWEQELTCPSCGVLASHYRYETGRMWKCREQDCGAQFSVFSGTRLHGVKMPPHKLLSILAHFVEAKDSISARELSGLHRLSYQTVHVLLLKIREALCETMSQEPPLTGTIQADAAYFIKYVRPGNVGTGAAFSAKDDRKNAGLDERGRAKRTVSKSMHALVVFAQCGPQGMRRYKVAKVKTETQVDLQHLAAQYCTPTSVLITDQHGAYLPFSAMFDGHHTVNHSEEFMSRDGFHTNLAENFFSRMRHAQGGAWHRMSVQYLHFYGWEFAWRQTMVGRSNVEQLQDLAKRLLSSGRPTRFIDYWKKRPAAGTGGLDEPEDIGIAVEIDKLELRKKMGRPRKGALKAFTADPSKPEVPPAETSVMPVESKQQDAIAAPAALVPEPDQAEAQSDQLS
jgi:transposase-like protein